ncbi:MAG: UDP-N-acetylmuramoyl-L-alanyl-D-glutamate--2,6-diaminopimelate ligase [Halanaerobiales bacterium]|jgi:UDP-N-acetylmuramoyl-L-alanyl-D-glutamate--2,6-diaminopimelate ligase|nr:UDP-N-acetylmuramoyl-L-alanyl-D-glutamate--2,6-diaminopimelate ligase [Bacillota bacterium]HOA40725.1 UDP-N-acetylmuramoyl-L-alanyl-D-glutamate--2,6-diaminopimelate ligase [Halanaerobiales bacterium]HPZ62227.1 UDP-N-acetylmuramoyl-L-alanyl-D-glutamate--2,6-diaminopimelate ligase [Halanaerobiales bacterium]HQD03617.1 UDP-N-acetylmuramoyl-L-alanyl-D-glutamate--2,6-diaminopimelate ligase [Halanaerobiales bacterium]
MLLKDLIKRIEVLKIVGNLDIEIKKMVYDSRQVEEGSLFICIEGFKDDGHDYINKAIQNGAVAIVVEKELETYPDGITVVEVADSRETMAYLAAAFFNDPLEKLDLIGVTGTNGKTTTTYIIKSILDNTGRATGLIGSIKNIIGEKTLPATRTTPESMDLYGLFAEMLENRLSHAVMEVSSHALDLKRVEGMDFKVAIFTNISQDHLDFHQSFDEYLLAKSKLFQQLGPGGFAVVNIDDPRSEQIIAAAKGEILTYAIKKEADFQARDIKINSRGVSFTVEGKYNFSLNMKLTGLFNVYNALAAIACGYALGLSPEEVKSGLEKVNGVAGRFEIVDEGQDFTVIVDFAHTPDGLENVLQTALELAKGKIHIVFGCGGDRDKGKRPEMGRIAAEYGDYLVLTSDNPRSEDPIAIIKDIEQGLEKSTTPYEVILDRREAIFYAIEKAGPGDMVLIFGKGHETYQIFKDKTISFDDRQVAREAIRERFAGDMG